MQTSITIDEALGLSEAIQQLSRIDQSSGKPVHALPFSLSYALARNAKLLQTALEPVEKKREELFEDWPGEQAKLKAEYKTAKDDKKPLIAQTLEKRKKEMEKAWLDVCKEKIDTDLYELPKDLKPEDKEQIKACSFTPQMILQLNPIWREDLI